MANQPSEWKDKHYAFFCNRECEYFPCHAGVDEAAFNCLFCYCPLYALGAACGGDFVMLENGIKDCSGCTIPHRREQYGEIIRRCQRLQQNGFFGSK